MHFIMCLSCFFNILFSSEFWFKNSWVFDFRKSYLLVLYIHIGLMLRLKLFDLFHKFLFILVFFSDVTISKLLLKV